MKRRWYERLPGWTTRTLSDEWHEHGGPPPGVKYGAEFAGLSDEQVLRYGMDIIAGRVRAEDIRR